ncbi:hypothetical protein J1N35_013023 [Gossypium stocksii]|uniref:Uncharacterized protein n=1 Tax=Gossypium stocksii TaxID=47602 RepID=A0A9D3VRY6_9ROSI|nr:hypothetical protein J1N35_013023 [Gossypium stocksii]
MVVWSDSVTICITWIVHSAHYLLHVIQGGTSKAQVQFSINSCVYFVPATFRFLHTLQLVMSFLIQYAVVAIIGPIPTPQNNSAGRYNSYSPNLLTESLQSSAVRDDDRNKKSHHP